MIATVIERLWRCPRKWNCERNSHCVHEAHIFFYHRSHIVVVSSFFVKKFSYYPLTETERERVRKRKEKCVYMFSTFNSVSFSSLSRLGTITQKINSSMTTTTYVSKSIIRLEGGPGGVNEWRLSSRNQSGVLCWNGFLPQINYHAHCWLSTPSLPRCNHSNFWSDWAFNSP